MLLLRCIFGIYKICLTFGKLVPNPHSLCHAAEIAARQKRLADSHVSQWAQQLHEYLYCAIYWLRVCTTEQLY